MFSPIPGNACDSRQIHPKRGAIPIRLAEGCSRVARSHAGFPQCFVSNASLCCIRATTRLPLHLCSVVVRCSGARRWPRQVYSRGFTASITWEVPYGGVLNDMVRIFNPNAPKLTIGSRYKCFPSS
jgi:hypothetical protein